MEIKDIQSFLQQEKQDAWILVDYENHNPAVVSLLGEKMLTRKIFMVIPSQGKPYLIAHQIDTVYLKDEATLSRFDLRVYHTWKEMLALAKDSFSDYRNVLMDISENGLLPRVSLADYGSVAFVKGLGINVSSSANLLQTNTSVLSQKSMQLQDEACKLCLEIKEEAFRFIASKIQENGKTDELEVQEFIAARFDQESLFYDEPPLVAIGKNASDPHYTPTRDNHSPIQKGDLVLIDMWAKKKDPEAAYADITWMAYVGSAVPEVYAKRFEIIRQARDAAIGFLAEELPKRKVFGYEVDNVAREVIEKAGFGPYFIHRLGHSIYNDDSPHGPGANLDDFESHDDRVLLEHTSFSDEPGIYAPDFGMRTETDLRIENGRIVVIAGLQETITPLLKD